MAATLKLGTNNNWATKEGKLLGYNDENGNFKPIPFDVTSDADATRVNKEGLIERTKTNVPRINFDGADNPYLLLEPTRTNYALNSNDASQWTNVGGSQSITKTQNYSTAPDGSLTATRLQATATGSNYSLIQISTTSFTGDYAGSVYLKSNTGDTENVIVYGRNTSVTSYAIGNEWQRIEIQGSGTSGQNLYLFLGSFPNNGSDESVDILVWGGQIEAGTYSTSLIPTEGSAVTRTAGTCQITSASGNIIGQTEGTLFIEMENFGQVGTSYGSFIKISDANDSTDRVIIQNSAEADNRIILVVRANSSTLFQPREDIPTGRVKIALKYKSGDIDVFINGVKEQQSTSTFSFQNSLNKIQIEQPNKVHQAMIFNEALSDAELISLTS